MVLIFLGTFFWGNPLCSLRLTHEIELLRTGKKIQIKPCLKPQTPQLPEPIKVCCCFRLKFQSSFCSFLITRSIPTNILKPLPSLDTLLSQASLISLSVSLQLSFLPLKQTNKKTKKITSSRSGLSYRTCWSHPSEQAPEAASHNQIAREWFSAAPRISLFFALVFHCPVAISKSGQ